MPDKGNQIKILIADDQRLVRDGIGSILSLQDDVCVCALCADGREALDAAERECPDVALLDIRMPVMDGIAAAEEMLSRKLAGAVIMLTTFDDEDYVVKALRAGASGYLLKDLPPQELLRAIRTVYGGGFQSTLSIMEKIRGRLSGDAPAGSAAAVDTLTRRERDVLALIGEGATNHEIASELGLSEGTVKNYVSGILDSMGFRDRIQAALYAAGNGLCTPPGGAQ